MTAGEITPAELRQLMAITGVSSEDIATKFGFNPSIVRRWRIGTRPIPAKYLSELREILDPSRPSPRPASHAPAQLAPVVTALIANSAGKSVSHGRPKWKDRANERARTRKRTRVQNPAAVLAGRPGPVKPASAAAPAVPSPPIADWLTSEAIASRISRGTFSAACFLAAMKSIGRENINLGDV